MRPADKVDAIVDAEIRPGAGASKRRLDQAVARVLTLKRRLGCRTAEAAA